MRFNILRKDTKAITNHQGGAAYRLSPEMELYTTVVTSSLSETFYEKGSDRIERLRTQIAACNPVFVGKLAVYARTRMHMRSVPLLLTTELARQHSGTNLVSRVTNGVVRRADEITELLACYVQMNGRTDLKQLNRLSKQMQSGLSSAFNRFDEYQFAKYDRSGAITLRDALFLVHPKAKDPHQQEVFDKIAERSLPTPYTWETELSDLGQRAFDNEEEKALAFRNAWESLIDSGALGYMALLRNLRNIIEAGVSYEHIRKACATLSSADQIAKAKQFPFRYLAAYRELLGMKEPAQKPHKRWRRLLGSSQGYVGTVLDALETAIEISAANIAGFDDSTRVLLACDVSGSMQTSVSARSKVLLYDVGLVLAMLLQSRSKNVTVGMFGTSWKTITTPRKNILANVQTFYEREGEVGYETNGYLVIKDLLTRRVVMDKVMIFTDCQLWNAHRGDSIQRLWTEYKRTVAPDARLYLFDLQGYGQTPLRIVGDVHLIAGWSDKVFDVLAAIERGGTALEAVHNIEL